MSIAIVCIAAFALSAYLLADDYAHHQIFGRYSRRDFALLMLVAYTLFWVSYLGISNAARLCRIGRFLLTTATLAMLIGALEFLAVIEAIDYRALFAPTGTIPLGAASLNSAWWRLDDELIHLRYPHQHIQGRTIGDIASHHDTYGKATYPIDVQYDANGFRNDRDLAEARIVVLGDSFVEAGIVATNETLTRLMQDELKVDVANLGVTMYGPQQELGVLRRYGAPLRPDIVVWLFFEGNDLLDARRYSRWRKVVARQYKSRVDRSFLRNALIKLNELTAPVPAPKRAESCQVLVGGKMVRMFFRYGGRSLDERDETGAAITQQTLLGARSICGDIEASFLLVYVPTKFRVYESLVQCPVDGIANRWQANELPQKMSAWCKEVGIDLLDLTPVLRDQAPSELSYFPDDSHWNSKGHKLASRAISKWIEEHGWLGKSTAPQK